MIIFLICECDIRFRSQEGANLKVTEERNLEIDPGSVITSSVALSLKTPQVTPTEYESHKSYKSKGQKSKETSSQAQVSYL